MAAPENVTVPETMLAPTPGALISAETVGDAALLVAPTSENILKK